MLPTSKFKRCFLVPELAYSTILKRSSDEEKHNIETLNAIHSSEKEGYFQKVLQKESNKPDTDSTMDNTSKSDNESDLQGLRSDVNPTQTSSTDQDEVAINHIQEKDKSLSFTPGTSSTPEKENAVSVNSLRCTKCLKRYVRKASFMKHKCRGSEQFKFDCKLCNEQFKVKEKLILHMSKKHQKKKLKLNRKYIRSY